MTRIRLRFDTISGLGLSEKSDVTVLETAAFHMRKIIEGVAFGCLVAYENGLKALPRDARGQWSADTIFARLAKKDRLVFPEPFIREDPPKGADPRVSHHIVADKPKALTVSELREIYRSLHVWLHEWNPYVDQHVKDFESRKKQLLANIPRVKGMIWSHLIGIGGEVFLGILDDPVDRQVRVVSASSSPLGKMIA